MIQTNDFYPLLEEIASFLKMNLEGKCYLACFQPNVIQKAYREVKDSPKVMNVGRLFMYKMKKAIEDGYAKPDWAKHYALMEKFNLKKNADGRYNYFN